MSNVSAGRGIVPYKLPDPGLTASGTRPAQTDSIILDEVSLGSGSPNVTHVPIWRPRVFETTTANPALSNNSLAASAVVAALAAPSVKVNLLININLLINTKL